MLAASKMLCSATLIGLLSFWLVLALHDEFIPAEALLVQLLMNVIGATANPVVYIHNPEGVVGNATLLLALWWTGVSKQTLVLDHLNCLLLILTCKGSARFFELAPQAIMAIILVVAILAAIFFYTISRVKIHRRGSIEVTSRLKSLWKLAQMFFH
jgi:hypothetical protein